MPNEEQSKFLRICKKMTKITILELQHSIFGSYLNGQK